MKSFEKATEKLKLYPSPAPEVVKTNCTDKIAGHSYRWLSGEEYNEVADQFPEWKGIGIVKCTKCGKVNGSM